MRVLWAAWPRIFVFVCLSAGAAHAQAARPTAGQLSKAEALLAKLRRAEAAFARGPMPWEVAEGRRLAEEVGESARGLSEGDLRTDLETAARLLTLAAGASDSPAAQPCEGERPGAYREACTSGAASARELLRRKARLHAEWARASLTLGRGEAGSELLKTLAAVESERRLDRELAASALRALRGLEGEVYVYRTLAEFEERGALARVPFERFGDQLGQTAAHVKAILAWLPEMRLKSELRNALRSYSDGNHRWSKIHCSRAVRAGSDCLTEADRARLGAAYLATTPYAVAVNWRNASKHLDRAEKILSGPLYAQNEEGRGRRGEGRAPRALSLR